MVSEKLAAVVPYWRLLCCWAGRHSHREPTVPADASGKQWFHVGGLMALVCTTFIGTWCFRCVGMCLEACVRTSQRQGCVLAVCPQHVHRVHAPALQVQHVCSPLLPQRGLHVHYHANGTQRSEWPGICLHASFSPVMLFNCGLAPVT